MNLLILCSIVSCCFFIDMCCAEVINFIVCSRFTCNHLIFIYLVASLSTFLFDSFGAPLPLGNASLFSNVLFTVFDPLPPPFPTSKMMDFLLKFYDKIKKTSNRIANPQPKLQTNPPRIANKQNYEQMGVSHRCHLNLQTDQMPTNCSFQAHLDSVQKSVIFPICATKLAQRRNITEFGPVFSEHWTRRACGHRKDGTCVV